MTRLVERASAVANAARGNEGWHARIELGFEPRKAAAGTQRTALVQCSRIGPLAVQRPFYPEGEVCHLYLLHPPGGVVGGDRLEISVDVAVGAHALITTPGATKFYRSAGALAEQAQHLHVAGDGALEWLPQESILFPGARLSSRTRVDLASGAAFIGWEMLSLGRPALAEVFHSGCLNACFELYRDGTPVLLERLRLDASAQLEALSGLRGEPLTATFVATPATEASMLDARAIIEAQDSVLAGVTLLDDLLVLRALASGAEPLQGLFRAVWSALRQDVVGKSACAPRIWAT